VIVTKVRLIISGQSSPASISISRSYFGNCSLIVARRFVLPNDRCRSRGREKGVVRVIRHSVDERYAYLRKSRRRFRSVPCYRDVPKLRFPLSVERFRISKIISYARELNTFTINEITRPYRHTPQLSITFRLLLSRAFPCTLPRSRIQF